MRKAFIGGLTITILVVMGGLWAADLWRSRDHRLADAEQRAGNLALILSEHLTEAFLATDAALRQLVLHSQRIGGPSAPSQDWTPSLASARAGIPGMGAISVVDVLGIIRHSTRADLVGGSRSDNYVVREAFDVGGTDLIVGAPFRAVVEPYGLLIPIGRRLADAKGDVIGVVVASFIPADLRRFFDSVNLGPRGGLWVFHRDGTVMFRSPSPANPMGEPAAGNPLFTAAALHPSGSVRGPVDGGADMVSAFNTANAPHLITAVSLNVDDVLSTWMSEARAFAWAYGGASVLLAVTLFVLFRQMDQKAVAERELASAREVESNRLRSANDRLAEALQREQVARRDAEAASALKDQFLMTVSHELRTPLTAIAGWSRLLADGMVGEGRRQTAIEAIARNARMQTRLIEDLLDVSAIMADRLQLEFTSVDVAGVVAAAIDGVRAAAEAKQIELELAANGPAAVVRGDSQRLHQVMANLLGNAVKFTPAGGRISVAIHSDHRHVEIAVRDTGIGIAADFLPHAFDQFRQQDPSPTRRHGGLGLGLAIVRSLVELHGGEVTAASEGENRGAMFVVKLPLEGR
jgi:signal transduction histidine kinase